MEWEKITFLNGKVAVHSGFAGIWACPAGRIQGELQYLCISPQTFFSQCCRYLRINPGTLSALNKVVPRCGFTFCGHELEIHIFCNRCATSRSVTHAIFVLLDTVDARLQSVAKEATKRMMLPDSATMAVKLQIFKFLNLNIFMIVKMFHMSLKIIYFDLNLKAL